VQLMTPIPFPPREKKKDKRLKEREGQGNPTDPAEKGWGITDFPGGGGGRIDPHWGKPLCQCFFIGERDGDGNETH